ncbi:hypothetical protein AcV5_010059 [Taiwanofungus camphoratus]|nr:hypothetical protein AcV5_010059 [Antrodia cinnamomea]
MPSQEHCGTSLVSVCRSKTSTIRYRIRRQRRLHKVYSVISVQWRPGAALTIQLDSGCPVRSWCRATLLGVLPFLESSRLSSPVSLNGIPALRITMQAFAPLFDIDRQLDPPDAASPRY